MTARGRVARLVEKLDQQIPCTPRTRTSSTDKAAILARRHHDSFNHLAAPRQKESSENGTRSDYMSSYSPKVTTRSDIQTKSTTMPERATDSDLNFGHKSVCRRHTINPDTALYNYMKSHNLFSPSKSTTGIIHSSRSTSSLHLPVRRPNRVRFADTDIKHPGTRPGSTRHPVSLPDLRGKSTKLSLLEEIRQRAGRPINNRYKENKARTFLPYPSPFINLIYIIFLVL